MDRKIILCLLGFLLFYGCKTPQVWQAETPLTDVSKGDFEQIQNQAQAADVLYQTYSATFTADINLADFKQSINGQIRMIKDSAIWATVGKFGIEVIRVLITKDSLYILNKLEQSLLVKPVNFLSTYVSNLNELSQFQNFLMGNPIWGFFQKGCRIKKGNGAYVFSQGIDKKIHTELHIDEKSLRPTQWSVFESQKPMADARYQWEQKEGKLVLSSIELKSEIPIMASIRIRFSKIVLNQEVSVPFTIPDKMNRE